MLRKKAARNDAAVTDTGEELTDEIPPAPESQTVEGDWVCVACEYPLRGLNRDAMCPECGTRIALSLRDDRLAHSNPLWLLKLSQGLALLCFASLVAMLCEIPLLNPISISPTSIPGHFLVRHQTLCTGLYWLGIWLIASPEYVASKQYRQPAFCWALRVVATISLWCQWALVPLLDLSPGVKLAMAVVGPVEIAMTYFYLRQVAQRIPDRSLVVQLPFVAASLIVANLVNHAWPRFEILTGLRATAVPTNVMRFVYVVATGYSVFILARFSTRVTGASNQAMENYLSERSSSDAPPSPPPPPPAG